MRLDTSKILAYMGYVEDRDFVSFQESRDSVAVKWLSQAPQPDDKAIDAAALELVTAEQTEEAKRIESHAARDDAKRALAALDTIIAEAPTATNAQMRMYVELLARIAKHHIIATVGR